MSDWIKKNTLFAYFIISLTLAFVLFHGHSFAQNHYWRNGNCWLPHFYEYYTESGTEYCRCKTHNAVYYKDFNDPFLDLFYDESKGEKRPKYRWNSKRPCGEM